MTYGVPYRGSKNRIAKDIIDILPSGHRFVDLFAGGCAITHAAILSGKWNMILSNDLCPLRGQTLFRLACQGEYNNEKYYRIPTKQEFYEKRDVEPHMVSVLGLERRHKLFGSELVRPDDGTWIDRHTRSANGIVRPISQTTASSTIDGS